MSQTPHKSLQKMCKSPKNSTYPTIKQEKIDYENLSTNCTVVGSNNLNLVKKPQIVTNMSPAYSNSSPVYPQSPYSSPASIKSPSPSLKPPTPQPNFPVMQIIHNNLLARPMQTSQPQNIIKLKPHLNILPKPSASPQSSPKPSVSPQIVIPTNHQQAAAAATIVPTAQPLLLNQMPMLTAPGVQFILRPQATAKIQPQVQTAGPGLILQPTSGQQLLQIQPPRTQPMVRVLTNGMQLTPTSTTTYVTQVGQQQPVNATQIAQQTIVNNTHQQQQIVHHQVKKKPKHKGKKKLDLANIMKLSGIGDEDDIQFESDTSQSESEPTSVPTTPQPQQMVQTSGTNFVHSDAKKNIQNIQISAIPQPTISAATPVVQVLNQNFQSGMISNSSSQAAAAQASIPFNSFITPNFTINNGLMLQRSGGFKLTMGEDGRLILQHDPTLNQDLQSQLILQSLLGLNGGLVLQPSMDQQTVQQTVQTIQQQSVQTIQQQTVQSQTIQTVQQQTVQPQTVQHTIQSLQPQIQQQTVQQTIQHQTVNALQQPMQIVQPQPIPSIHSQVQPIHSIAQSQVHHLQSQIQSLLQQQAQNISPQTLQNVQNLQNLQNVQSIQQNVQTLPQSVSQTVHPQTIQSPVHSVQNFSTQTPTTQPVLKVQPFQKSQPPVQTVQPIQHHNHPQQQQQHVSDNQSQNNPPPTSYVVNLTPEQLEQLKRNGQLTVNGQTIFMQRPNKDQNDKKMSPKSKPPIKKVNKIQSIKSILQDNVNDSVKTINNTEQIKESAAKPIVSALNAPKHVLPQNHVQPQPIQSKSIQQQAMVQPHAMVQPSVQVQSKVPQERTTKPIQLSPQIAKPQKVSPQMAASSPQTQDSNGSNTNPDVDKLLGQILEESNNINSTSNNVPPTTQPQQRITTIQLTPQRQQQLKSIQIQIQTLSARLTPGDAEMQTALKLLFAEQQKILASGKLLPPDKVYYHNNQLTIVNPSSLNLSPPVQVKNEPPSPSSAPQQQQQQTSQNVGKSVDTQTSSHQSVTPTHNVTRLTIPSSETTATQTIHHHPQPLPHPHTHSHPPSNVPNQSNLQRNQSPHHHNHISVPVAGIQQQNSGGIPPPPSQTHIQHHHTVVSHQSHHIQRLQHPIQQVNSHQQQLQQQQQQQQQHVLQNQQQTHQQQPQLQFHSLAKKAHLIETQLNLDQNGAIKPDIHTPFRDKKDACIRLIRYHCLDQPVLSVKDLDKADEIFELTARHFIGKYGKMVDKYKYLLMKESMRQVQTSELMMLDRMFLADEQQSLMKLRQEYENQLLNIPSANSEPSTSSNHQQLASGQGSAQQAEPPAEDYDEWACIQRELGCLPQNESASKASSESAPQPPQQHASVTNNNSKRSAGSDSRLETLKRFRVDKHHKKPTDVHINCSTNSNSSVVQSVTTVPGCQSTIYTQCSKSSSYESLQIGSYPSQHEDNEPENNSIDEQVQSAIDSILNLQQNTPIDLDSILS